MKRIIAILLIICLVFTFFACSKDEDNATETSTSDTSEVKTENGTTKTGQTAQTGSSLPGDTTASAGAGKTTTAPASDSGNVTTTTVDIGKVIDDEGLDINTDDIEIIDFNAPPATDIEDDLPPEPSNASFISQYGVTFENAKKYDSVASAMSAAGVSYSGLDKKFADFKQLGTYVLSDNTLVIRFGYSSTYMDFRIKAGSAPYSGDYSSYSFSYTGSKTAENGDSCTLSGDAEDKLYILTATEGSNHITLVAGEPLPFEELDWRLSE